MAKKKVAHQAKVSKQEAPQPQDLHIQDQNKPRQSKPFDDSSEKLENLKSLNSLLLKETFERRQQVESLEQSKEVLETELTRSGMENMVLETELTRAVEESVGLDLEKSVVCAFWETQMDEMGVGFDGLVKEKGEIESIKCEREAEVGSLKKEVNELFGDLENEKGRLKRVCQERDVLKSKIDGLVVESNGLREKVEEMEKNERKIEEEVEKLGMERERLMGEKAEIEKAVEAEKMEKELVEGKLELLEKVVEGLRSEIESVVREKGEIERVKGVQEVKIAELEKKVGKLNEIVLNLRDEEGLLRSKVLELEKRIGEAMEKEKEMVMEINVLVKEKREKEEIIEVLNEQRDSIQNLFDMNYKESKDKQSRVEELIREKIEIEEVKVSKEGEIVELQTEASKLRDTMSTLQESYRDEVEKNKKLLSEVRHFRDAYDQVKLERDEVQKGFDEEKKKVKSMEVTVSEMEKRVVGAGEELGQMRSERENLIEKNKAMERQLEVLVKENDLVQKRLVEAQQGIDDLRAKMESSGINLERALSMVKNTATLVCHSKDDSNGKEELVVNEQKLEEEIQLYAAELDAIQKAFRNKDKMVEDMKKHVEILQSSVADAQKKKSFWTVVSSATTFLAAASVAYVARGR